jgi:hypothetical protein
MTGLPRGHHSQWQTPLVNFKFGTAMRGHIGEAGDALCVAESMASATLSNRYARCPDVVEQQVLLTDTSTVNALASDPETA